MVSLLFLPHIRMIIYYKPLLRAGTKSHSVLHTRAWYSLWFTGGNGVGREEMRGRESRERGWKEMGREEKERNFQP